MNIRLIFNSGQEHVYPAMLFDGTGASFAAFASAQRNELQEIDMKNFIIAAGIISLSASFAFAETSVVIAHPPPAAAGVIVERAPTVVEHRSETDCSKTVIHKQSEDGDSKTILKKDCD
jgi:hypothetical protein